MRVQRTRSSAGAVLLLSAVHAACVPYRSVTIASGDAQALRGGSSFFVTSDNCGAPDLFAEMLVPWFKEWLPSAGIAPTESAADVVIDWYQEPCVICADCDEVPVPLKAKAELRFRTGQRATWLASRPLACVTRDCLPPMLAKAIVAVWEGK
jgi:hypothetical protein